MKTPRQNSAKKIKALREQIETHGVGGYLIPKADEFQGEFVAPYAERLKWLTGFTGSAGVAIVMQDKAAVLSDGRYTIQLGQQVDADVFEAADSVKFGIHGWLDQHGFDEAAIGYDPWLFTPAQLAKLKEYLPELQLVPISENLIDKIWDDQPPKPKATLEVFNEQIAGQSVVKKKTCVADAIKKQDAQAAIITLPDSIAWLLNVRGNDTPYIPGVQAYAIVDAQASKPVTLFIDDQKISDEVQNHFADNVEIKPLEALKDDIRALSEPILLDDKRSPEYFAQILKNVDIEVKNAKDPCIDIKAVKTPEEMQAIRNTHIADGLALVKFVHWLESASNQSEISVAEKLEDIRATHSAFKQNSFPTIAGFGANGAIVHYRADEKTDTSITSGGLLLLDSGGQYYDDHDIAGTTDITRTIAIGEPTQEMRESFTRVLKGHINLAKAVFEKDKTGKDVDEFARAPLKEHGLDFAHGTGHGVGCYLAVHEEATSISYRSEETFKAGMLISNEPGYYKEGEYGIRIENLVFVVEKDESHYGFETISFAPIDRALIIADILSDEEKDWLNTYHEKCFELLSPHLDDTTKNWLKNATARI